MTPTFALVVHRSQHIAATDLIEMQNTLALPNWSSVYNYTLIGYCTKVLSERYSQDPVGFGKLLTQYTITSD